MGCREIFATFQDMSSGTSSLYENTCGVEGIRDLPRQTVDLHRCNDRWAKQLSGPFQLALTFCYFMMMGFASSLGCLGSQRGWAGLGKGLFGLEPRCPQPPSQSAHSSQLSDHGRWWGGKQFYFLAKNHFLHGEEKKQL